MNKPQKNSNSASTYSLRGKPYMGPLEVNRSDTWSVVLGRARVSSSGELAMELHHLKHSISIDFRYSPRASVVHEGSIRLPLPSFFPEDLFRLLRKEKAWMFWPYVDGFIRTAMEEVDLPSDFTSDVDFELRVLMAVFNAPAVSKDLESWRTKEARTNALARLSDRELQRKMVGVTQTMRSILGTRTDDMRVVRAFGNFMRKSYEFYCEELRRRELEVAHMIANPK